MSKAIYFETKASSEFPKDSENTLKLQVVKKLDNVTLQDNQFSFRVIYNSVDPVMRVWYSGATTYLPSQTKG